MKSLKQIIDLWIVSNILWLYIAFIPESEINESAERNYSYDSLLNYAKGALKL